MQAVWHPATAMKRHEQWPLIPIERAKGAWLIDFEGNAYLDAISSWWVNLFGHGHSHIKAAITDQLKQVEHIMLAGLTHQTVIELSERLQALSGLGHAFYASDGASAVEIALKMSVHYWKNENKPQKNRFLCLENSYHGETVGALAVTDIPLFSAHYAALLRQAVRIPSPDARQAQNGETAYSIAQMAADQLASILAEQHTDIAALIVEPLVQGAAGMVMYHEHYLSCLRALCDRYQVHLIADEIAVGFGRTGSLFACEQAAITPDFLCLSKGLTGGFLPLSCVLTRDDIYRSFYHDDHQYAFLHSHSYTGNALACRAALEVLNIFDSTAVLAENRAKAAHLSQQLAPIEQYPHIQHLRHRGMIWAFDVQSTDPHWPQRFCLNMLKRGVWLRPIGPTVYLMPPYCINDDEIHTLAQATLEALAIEALN